MSKPERIAVIRIELEDIEPLIWRRVAVRESVNLKDIHCVIQAAMGWQDYHLWQFIIGDDVYGPPELDNGGWEKPIHRAGTMKLAQIIERSVKAFDYAYDFGDDWRHRVVIEKVAPVVAGAAYPAFLGGERRCPPEDCGGMPGYFEFIAAIERAEGKTAKDKKEALAWYGQNYDPDDIGEPQIRTALGRLTKAKIKAKPKAKTNL